MSVGSLQAFCGTSCGLGATGEHSGLPAAFCKTPEVVKTNGNLKCYPSFILYSNVMCRRNLDPFVVYYFGHV